MDELAEPAGMNKMNELTGNNSITINELQKRTKRTNYPEARGTTSFLTYIYLAQNTASL